MIKDSDPANGTLSINPDGSFNYTPNAGFTGTDSFTYRAGDGTATSNVATAMITVNPVDQGRQGDLEMGHARALLRRSRNVVLLFDGDE